uniref:Uncharacterized protein n=1 Tax=Virus sp. ctAgr11 TaxID=2825800 RepID=A0A8S5RJ56_9VIRU|nr:MAG TPA: hypothetical protein [Virus sp. ctAgr11]
MTVVWFAGSLLKETGMVNPPVRRGNQQLVFCHRPLSFLCGFRC